MTFFPDNNTPRESNGGVPTNLQDQTSEMALSPFHIDVGSGQFLAADTVVDTYTISLSAGHGASPGHIIILRDGVHHFYAGILSFAGDVATIDSPMDWAFTTGETLVTIGLTNLNVDGSGTRVIAHIIPPPGVQWDVTAVHLTMTSTTVMTSDKFGGIAGLTKGFVLRQSGGVYKNIANTKTNQQLVLYSSLYEYDPKPPTGLHGFFSTHRFAGQENVGVTMRLNGATSDKAEAIIQDDLRGLATLAVLAVGHVVTD